MADDTMDLRSVNWSQGMFLTPDHFLRQERYFDSLLLWWTRHALDISGLIGGGPRVAPAERGVARFDPIVDIDETADALRVTIPQCRGITQGGSIVEIDPERPVSGTFSKRELEGGTEVGVYVVARPHAKEPDGRVADPINPQMEAGRRFTYRVKLDVQADETEWALLVARLRRAERGLSFERVAGFIPPCAFMSSHTGLMDAFRTLNESVASIADRYSILHRAIVDYIGLARVRGIGVEQDLETLEFVSRMLVTIEQVAYAVLDPLQSPRTFFQELSRLVRSAALFLSLSPPTRQYFAQLGEIGEVEFASMLTQEGDALESGRKWSIHDDLSLEAQKARRALDRLARLELALEGKYLDFRISPSLESLNFVFDRSAGDPVLYKLVSKTARPQAQGEQLTFVFAPLRLESRETYRIILIGDRQARFTTGDRVAAEIRINAGEGYSQKPDFQKAEYEVDGQRNIALDFRAPADINTINDIRVSLRSAQPIRSAIVYVRHRMVGGGVSPVLPPPPVRPIESGQRPETRPRPRIVEPTDPEPPISPISGGRKRERLT